MKAKTNLEKLRRERLERERVERDKANRLLYGEPEKEKSKEEELEKAEEKAIAADPKTHVKPLVSHLKGDTMDVDDTATRFTSCRSATPTRGGTCTRRTFGAASSTWSAFAATCSPTTRRLSRRAAGASSTSRSRGTRSSARSSAGLALGSNPNMSQTWV